MIAIRSHNPSFRPSADDYLPPSNIEAEESILGGILLDPEAIEVVSQRLVPEHLYNSTNREVYLACLALHKQGKRTDMLKVTDYLLEKNKLLDLGVRKTLAHLVDRCISTVNINELVTLVIQKYTRRRLKSLGEEIRYLAVSGEYEYDELMAILTKKTSEIILNPGNLSNEQKQQVKHKRIIDQLTEIFTKIPNPSFRFFKLKELAQDYGYSTNFLEQLYLKSLTGQCSKLLSYEELKQLGGSEVREWLLNGLVPKASTILLAADGGKGKTKLVYRIAKYLIEGKDFGDFTATGKRKILYYQGDESPGDMVQALEMMGYSNPEINQNVKIRFGWSAENMPTLINDIQEFQPDFVMIDSLSTANKFSIHKESDMEYARPLLEMAGLAATSGCTFLIVHHTNKDGGVRGTTAIRNAVSEVWSLSSDTSNQALPNDRILEINKSRSRSSGKKYKLFFNDEHLEFVYLGEDGEDKSTTSTRGEIREFLRTNRNIRFTAKEIAYRLNRSDETVRRILGAMGGDGIVSKITIPGKANLYYLEGDCIEKTSHHPIPPLEEAQKPCNTRDTTDKNNDVANITIPPAIPPLEKSQKSCDTRDTTNKNRDVTNVTIPPSIPPLEESQNPCEASDSEKAGITNPDFQVNKTLSVEKVSSCCEKPSHHPTFAGNPDDTRGESVGSGGGIPGGIPGGMEVNTTVIDNAPLQSVTQKTINRHPSFDKNKSQKLRITGITGIFHAKYLFDEKSIHLILTTPQKLKLTVDDFYQGWNWQLTLEDFRSVILAEIYRFEMSEMLKDRTFTVQRSKYDKDKGCIPVKIPNCKLVGVPSEPGRPFVFQLPKGDNFPIYKAEDFELNDAPNNPQLPL